MHAVFHRKPYTRTASPTSVEILPSLVSFTYESRLAATHIYWYITPPFAAQNYPQDSNICAEQVLSIESYWSSMQQLPQHLSTKAPALRSLQLFLQKDSSQDAAYISQPNPHLKPGDGVLMSTLLRWFTQ